jgi:hypothetical protein
MQHARWVVLVDVMSSLERDLSRERAELQPIRDIASVRVARRGSHDADRSVSESSGATEMATVGVDPVDMFRTVPAQLPGELLSELPRRGTDVEQHEPRHLRPVLRGVVGRDVAACRLPDQQVRRMDAGFVKNAWRSETTSSIVRRASRGGLLLPVPTRSYVHVVFVRASGRVNVSGNWSIPDESLPASNTIAGEPLP